MNNSRRQFPAGSILGAALLLVIGSSSVVEAQTAKTLTRKWQPAVRYAGNSDLTAKDVLGLRLEAPFLGAPISQIVAYKYDILSSSWIQVPFQIDQRAWVDFGPQLQCEPNTGFPPCACDNDPNTDCSGVVCEESYLWEGQSDPDGDGLDANDQVVFIGDRLSEAFEPRAL